MHEPPYTTPGFLTSPKFGAAGSGGSRTNGCPKRSTSSAPKEPACQMYQKAGLVL